MNLMIQRSQIFFDVYIKNFKIQGDKNKFNRCRMACINYILDVSAKYFINFLEF
jgi:hypothetical protein